MPKSITRTYSRYSSDAVSLLGSLIRAARKERRLSAQEVAERAGISRGMLQRIEKGDMKCEIGVFFEVAAVLGLTLFNAEQQALTALKGHTEDKLALLPKTIHKPRKAVDDAF